MSLGALWFLILYWIIDEMPLPLGTVLVRTLPIVSMDKMVVIVNIWTYITVDEPKSNTIIIWTPIFERYVTM